MDALLAIAVKLVPAVETVVKGDKTGNFEMQVKKAVSDATGTTDSIQAQAKLDADPALKAGLVKALSDAVTIEEKRQEQASRDVNPSTDQRSAQDIQNARDAYSRALMTGSAYGWINPFLSIQITGSFVVLVFYMLIAPPADMSGNQVFNIALGSLATAFATVIAFHFGSSIGSKQKDNVNTAIVAEGAIKRDLAGSTRTPG